VLCEHATAEWINLAERNCSHSGSFKSEAETADAGKEVEDIHLPSH
jgi:hypothetical protein